MSNFFKSSGVAACGLATSLLTALLVIVIQQLTSFDIFTFNVWVIVPAGALLCGCVATSGYYFGSLYFHTRPTLLLAVQMVAIAGLTQALIYYGQYATLIVDGERASNLISFEKYLEISLTTAHYVGGRAGQIDIGEVGQFGYWLAALQFVGFLVGGLFMFAILLGKPVCRPCNKYLRLLDETYKRFGTFETLADYHDTVLNLPVDGPDFATMVRGVHKASGDTVWTMGIKLYGCPDCKGQRMVSEASVSRGQNSKTIKERTFIIPHDINLVPVFRAEA